jgi:hypothetical protein
VIRDTSQGKGRKREQEERKKDTKEKNAKRPERKRNQGTVVLG